MKKHSEHSSLTAPLFPGKGNLPRVKWREVLAELAKPAVRIHEYRTLSSSIFYDAMHEDDCGKPS